jgi:glycosyltransferase involved in cell wall biosynthesis
MAESKAEELHGEMVDGLQRWRIHWPRAYPVATFQRQPAWRKPIWHLQDHLDPRNVQIVGEVIDAFRPDFINIHYLQGAGYNALAAIAKRDVPTVYVVNELGLACIRMSMFKHGRQCEKQCFSCRLSSRFKAHEVGRVPRFGFWSPSKAALDQLGALFPLGDRPRTHVVYPNRYTRPTVARKDSGPLRFTYVGRLHPSKGVDVLLEAAAPLAETNAFTVRIVGSGPNEQELRARWHDKPWVSFAGHVDQQQVANEIASGDVLCVPSVWPETLGMVIVHALLLGTPVLGSNIGGIPELVRSGANGLLLPPGDVAAWRTALASILASPERLRGWRDYAIAHAADFDQDTLGNRVLTFMNSVLRGEKAPSR